MTNNQISSSTAEDGKARTIKKTFSRQTAVAIEIHAEPAIVWALLTSAQDYPRWNTTILSIEGDIEPGAEIKLQSTLDPQRTFKLKVKEFEPQKRLVWGDNMGSREYTISPVKGDQVVFTMMEKMGGLLFPLFAGKIPSFDASFEQFAADLKKEAEEIYRSEN